MEPLTWQRDSLPLDDLIFNYFDRLYTFNQQNGIPMSDDQCTEEYKAMVETLRNFCNVMLEGNIENVRKFMEVSMEQLIILFSFTEYSQNILGIAIRSQNYLLVDEVLKLMPADVFDYYETNTVDFTSLHDAAVLGNFKAAKALVERSPNLTQIPDVAGCFPLFYAAKCHSDGQKQVLEYLCNVTKDVVGPISPFSGPQGAAILCHTIGSGHYDIALFLVQRYPKLITEKTNYGDCAIENLALMPFAFKSGSRLKFWERWIYLCITVDLAAPCHRGVRDVENPPDSTGDISVGGRGCMSKFISILVTYLTKVSCVKYLYEEKLKNNQAYDLVKFMCKEMTDSKYDEFFEKSNFLKTAVSFGTNELVKEFIRTHNKLDAFHIIDGRSLLDITIEVRNEKILSLLCKKGVLCGRQLMFSKRETHGSNTPLHLTAKLAPAPYLDSISGGALQMQREIQWFKGMENLLLEIDRVASNKDGKTAQAIFTEEHKDLAEKGERWMKDTANSCMLAATLITTVMFASAFTVPGGTISDTNSKDNGIPIFLYNTSFMVFAIADALGLFSSITSVLMFLAILTSRYREEDFLWSLPKKLIIGLGTLFISIAAMMVVFGAALSIVVGRRLTWLILIGGLVFACVPVALFAWMQLPLFFEIVRSTYWPSLFYIRRQRMFQRHTNKKEK